MMASTDEESSFTAQIRRPVLPPAPAVPSWRLSATLPLPPVVVPIANSTPDIPTSSARRPVPLTRYGSYSDLSSESDASSSIQQYYSPMEDHSHDLLDSPIPEIRVNSH